MHVQREITAEAKQLAQQYPVITITGPRQSGKTTLVRTVFTDKPYITLEDPDTRERIMDDPRGFLKTVPNGAILDEIQRLPELLSYIQGVVDSVKKTGMFILTGSQQLDLNAKVSQSLAGRTAILKLLPFTMEETAELGTPGSVDRILLHGFYPGVHDRQLEPYKAYKNYFETYIQRDLNQLVHLANLRLFRKFVRLCAGRVGSLFNASNLANEVGVSVPTIQSWTSLLEASFVIFLLEPFHENIGKRLIKSPKLYFYDVGLAAYLLGIENESQLQRDRMRGPLVENLVLMELVKKRYNAGLDHNLFFYRDSHQNEVDILYRTGDRLVPYEVKSAETYTSDFLKGLHYLSKLFPGRIERGYVVYTGSAAQELGDCTLIPYQDVGQTLTENH